jgi:GH25 family lysozyme M1 (1,4-beta-N-acetylmuramidase)
MRLSDQDDDMEILDSLSKELREKGKGKGKVNGKKPRRKRRTLAFVLGLMGCMAVLVVVIFLAGLLYEWIDRREIEKQLDIAEKEATVYNQEEANALVAEAVAALQFDLEEAKAQGAAEVLDGLASSLSAGETVVESLRPFYPDNLVLVSGGKYHFVPIRDDLKKNTYVQENLQILENGEYQYMENGLAITRKGVDVSYHQGAIDWTRVAATGVEYAILRVGYRGYGTGALMADEQFEANIQGALSAGLKVGVYFFSQAINEAEVLEEANFVLEQIAPYKVDYPVIIDVEKVSDSAARMNLITVEERTNLVKVFVQKVAEAGYHPMIYHNMEMAALMLHMEELEEYDKWFAYYNPELYYPYDYQMWQYSAAGRVDGIEGDVDMNISFKNWERK